MPIVTIEVIEDVVPAPLAAATVQSLADALGELFGSDTAGTWVKVQSLPRARYAENGRVLDVHTRPVLVEIIKADIADTQVLAEEAAAVSRLVAQQLHRSQEHVHVIYQAGARGRIAFGGELVR